MFKFKLEPDLRLLTAVRTGTWSLAIVREYESTLRQYLAKLHRTGPQTSFIIDIRASGPQPKPVADALRSMVTGLGPLRAQKTAIVTASGIAKLQAAQMGDSNAQVFTTMILARDWALCHGVVEKIAQPVHDEACEAAPLGGTVHILGPADVDLILTPAAALETAQRVKEAATAALTVGARAKDVVLRV